MKLAILIFWAILSPTDTGAICSGCSDEAEAVVLAEQAVADASALASAAAAAYYADPTPYNYGFMIAAFATLDGAYEALDAAEQAYIECLMGGGSDPVENTISILE